MHKKLSQKVEVTYRLFFNIQNQFHATRVIDSCMSKVVVKSWTQLEGMVPRRKKICSIRVLG